MHVLHGLWEKTHQEQEEHTNSMHSSPTGNRTRNLEVLVLTTEPLCLPSCIHWLILYSRLLSHSQAEEPNRETRITWPEGWCKTTHCCTLLISLSTINSWNNFFNHLMPEIKLLLNSQQHQSWLCQEGKMNHAWIIQCHTGTRAPPPSWHSPSEARDHFGWEMASSRYRGRSTFSLQAGWFHSLAVRFVSAQCEARSYSHYLTSQKIR